MQVKLTSRPVGSTLKDYSRLTKVTQPPCNVGSKWSIVTHTHHEMHGLGSEGTDHSWD